jgi:peptidoglycan/xylan/chitin deacetylase (PgdA/CDA1 family)
LKSGLALGLSQSRATALLGIGRGSKQRPLVIGYHRVVEDFDASSRTAIPSMLISAGMLEKHLDWLARHYRLVSLPELGTCLEQGSPTAGMAAITFDDGYRDVYEHAFPILKRKGIPAAIFVVTNLVGTSRAMIHDRLYDLLQQALSVSTNPAEMLAGLHRECGLRAPDALSLERAGRNTFAATRLFLDVLPQLDIRSVIAALESRLGAEQHDGGLPLTWDMVHEMRLAGVTFGSHSSTHALLTHEDQDRKESEISGSRRILEERLGTRVDHFAYPDGRFDSATVSTVAAAGYRFAYTICAHRDPKSPLLTLSRRILWERACVDARGAFSGAVLDCLLSGVFDVMAPCPMGHGPGIEGRPLLRAAWSGATS